MKQSLATTKAVAAQEDVARGMRAIANALGVELSETNVPEQPNRAEEYERRAKELPEVKDGSMPVAAAADMLAKQDADKVLGDEMRLVAEHRSELAKLRAKYQADVASLTRKHGDALNELRAKQAAGATSSTMSGSDPTRITSEGADTTPATDAHPTAKRR